MFNYDLSLRVTSSGSFLLPISPFHTLSQSLTSIFVKVQQLYLSKIKFILSLTHPQGITALSLDVSTLSSSLSLLLQLVSLVNLLLFRDDGDVGVNQIGLQKD